MKRIPLICAAVGILICSPSWRSHAQTAADSVVTVRFSNGQTVAVTDFSEPIGVAPNETVHLTVALSGPVAGEPISVASLDGGRIISPSSISTASGTVAFVFQATGNVGQNRIEVRHGLQKLRVQFWVMDTANPQNNPPVITAANPEG